MKAFASANRWRTCALVVALTVLADCGCAGLHLPSPNTQDVAQEREKRKAEFVREFEAKRDQAQYHAAVGRWREGDRKATQLILEPLLARRPDYAEAHLLMAELLSNTDPEGALEHA